MEKIPTIQFLICTINERISRVPSMLLSPVAGISYLVSWQQYNFNDEAKASDEIHDALIFLEQRSDVYVVSCQSKGLSRNRNNAIQHARGDLLVIADDDCVYTLESIKHIRQAFDLHPDASIIQMQIQDYAGKLIHDYPRFTYEYSKAPFGTYISSCELVLRRSSALPHFDERFGIGAYLGCGEEEVFVYQAHSVGLKIFYEPLLLVSTEGSTTGSFFRTNPAVQRAKGGVLSVLHGPIGAVLRCFKYIYFLSHFKFTEKLLCFWEAVKGICYEVYTRHSIL